MDRSPSDFRSPGRHRPVEPSEEPTTAPAGHSAQPAPASPAHTVEPPTPLTAEPSAARALSRADDRSPAETNRGALSSADAKARTDRLRNETGVAIGVMASLASLVQGYDGEQIAQTVLMAVIVGGGGLWAFYTFTKRH